jgi:hypothetical protein
MEYFMRDLENFVESGNFSSSTYYISKYSKEDYTTLFEVLKDWIFDGLEQHLPNEEVEKNSHLLISSSLIYCSWIITHVLKKGVNDHSYNTRKLKYVFSKTELDSKVDLSLVEEFLISGLGMAISQCSEILSIPNNDICHMVVSLNLMMTEHMISESKEQRVA